MEIVKISPENLELVQQFLTPPISSHFRYFEHRSIEVCCTQHAYTIVGLIDQIPIAYGHIDKEEKYWLGICIKENYQGKGYGKQLMTNLLNFIKKSQITNLWLTVDCDNNTAIRMYLNFGFIITSVKTSKIFMKYAPQVTNSLMLPVSYGEAFDKLTILDIKLSKILDERRVDVKKEYDAIWTHISPLFDETVQFHYDKLKEVNLNIWEMQDIFRGSTDLDQKNKLCVEIIEENDRRFRIKSKINYLLNSSLKEQKGYVKRRAYIVPQFESSNHLANCGLVRYFSTIYDEVFAVCCEKDLENLKSLYSDDPTIKFHVIQDANSVDHLSNENTTIIQTSSLSLESFSKYFHCPKIRENNIESVEE